ncbi:tetratricopeptide repeat protein [Flavobacterium agrisoli]|uniref:Tetratricopeptide repeat protein n=1 Tax=Flavobacterium agrisoli TaxID=2793066 RepID=A0A934PHG7_9FLAO|nr:hypothetical protein [Flavobacterium agrisoli]MBK0368201.1 hypothetical protein [Flavobacterium agrisoli]
MNFNSLLVVLFTFVFWNGTFSQGFWDKERSTYREITISAFENSVIETEELPIGTTEIVFRITLLDKNQTLANSLVSVLKAVPDPTGISQGSAGAVWILSSISGEDKCKYSIFSTKEDAASFLKTKSNDQACFIQNTPVSKDARRLTVGNSACLNNDKNRLWFVFENTNWIMNQKIILEVVPWVDKKVSRGWNTDAKKVILANCKTSLLAQKMTNSDDFCLCILDKISAKYRYDEFNHLLPIEKNKNYKDFGAVCYDKKNINEANREQALRYMEKNDFAKAIPLFNEIVESGKGNVLDFNKLGYSYLITKQYDKALKTLLIVEELDDSELLIKLNLAHTYLLKGDYSQAKKIYKKYQNQNVAVNVSWSDKIKIDFETFRKYKLPTDDFDKVLHLIDN